MLSENDWNFTVGIINNEVGLIEGDYDLWIERENYLLSNINQYETLQFANRISVNSPKINDTYMSIEDYEQLIKIYDSTKEYVDSFYLTVFRIMFRRGKYAKNNNSRKLVDDLQLMPNTVFDFLINILVNYDLRQNRRNIIAWLNTWYIILETSRKKQIFDSIKLSNCFSGLQINIGDYASSTLVDINLDIKASNVIDTFNAFLILGIDNSFIRFILTICTSGLFSGSSKYLSESLKKINFEALNSMIYSNEDDELCQLLLLLLSPDPVRNIDSLIDSFLKFSHRKGILTLILSFVEDKSNISPWVFDFLVSIHSHRFFANILHTSSEVYTYYYQIKAQCDSKPVSDM